MSNKPTVSIIVPVYNAGSTVHAALDSAISQVGIIKQILVADGASTDNSLSIIRSFGERINLIASEPDRGVYDAINKALNHCEGEWIYVMGADDRLASDDALYTLIQAQQPGDLLLYGNVSNINSSNKWVPQLHKSSFDRRLHWRNSLHQQSVLYHHSLFADFRFNILYKVLADYDFHLKLLSEGIQARHIDRVIAICEAGGLSKNFNRNLYREELQLKKLRLNTFLFAANMIWVQIKFLIKKWLKLF